MNKQVSFHRFFIASFKRTDLYRVLKSPPMLFVPFWLSIVCFMIATYPRSPGGWIIPLLKVSVGVFVWSLGWQFFEVLTRHWEWRYFWEDE